MDDGGAACAAPVIVIGGAARRFGKFRIFSGVLLDQFRRAGLKNVHDPTI